MNPDHPMLKRAYNLRDKPDLLNLYRDWAGSYEDDLADIGFVGYRVAADRLRELVTPDAQVLDAGCGTGLVGAQLAAAGFTAIDGLDLSADMLRVAGQKRVGGRPVYRALAEGDLLGRLPLESGSYDAVICVGTFTHGHVGPPGIAELVRVTKAGGPLVLTVIDGSWDAEDFPGYLAGLRETAEISDFTHESAPYHQKEGLTCQLVVLTR